MHHHHLTFLVPALCSVTAAQAPSFEPRRLGEIPNGITLQGPPIPTPNGDTITPRSSIVWSPDGTRFAFVGYRGSTSHPVLDGEVGDAFHFVSPPAFSADSQHAVFRVGNRITARGEAWWPLVDGNKGERYDWIGEIGIGPDGTLAFWEQAGAAVQADGAYGRGEQVLHFGERRSEPFDDALGLVRPLFTADGRAVFGAAMRNGRWHVLRIDARGKVKTGPKRGASMIQDLALSPDGRRWACTAASERGGGAAPPGLPGMGMMPGSKLVVLDDDGDEHGTDFDCAGAPVFAPNGKRFAFKIVDGERMAIAFDKGRVASQRFDYVTQAAWSPDGKRVAYGGYTGSTIHPFQRLQPHADTAVTGGSARLVTCAVGRQPDVGDDEYDAIRSVTFGPDGDVIAFAAKIGDRWHVVAGERRSDGFDQVGEPVFDPATGKVGFGALVGDEVWWKVLE